MRTKDWEAFWGNISRQLTVSLLAKEPTEDGLGTCLKVESNLPVFDAIGLFEKCDYLKLPDGRVIKKNSLMKRPLRILFFIFLTELESKLYRTQEWSGRPVKELNEINMNSLIRDLVNDDVLFSYQTVYKTRSKFKEELKAISSLRNIVAHVNKRLELDIDYETVLKRKGQMQRLLGALTEILDKQEKARVNGQGT